MRDKPNLTFISVANHDYSVLPKGIRPTTESEFQHFFVDSFPSSTTRHEISQKYANFRSDLSKLFPTIHWIDSSFVESKIDPGDIDVAIIYSHLDACKLPLDQQDFYSKFFKYKDIVKDKYKTHAFAIIAFPNDHPNYPNYLIARNYWEDLFGHTRSEEPKFFIELRQSKD